MSVYGYDFCRRVLCVYFYIVIGKVYELGGQMNTLTKHETVWLQAYCAHSNDPELQVKQLAIYADAVLALFQSRFPSAQPPQKESVSGVAPNPSKDRRERWIAVFDTGSEFVYDHESAATKSGAEEIIHVTELRPGEVIVNREMLAKAWDEKRGTHGPHDFERFCKALGLKDE